VPFFVDLPAEQCVQLHRDGCELPASGFTVGVLLLQHMLFDLDRQRAKRPQYSAAANCTSHQNDPARLPERLIQPRFQGWHQPLYTYACMLACMQRAILASYTTTKPARMLTRQFQTSQVGTSLTSPHAAARAVKSINLAPGVHNLSSARLQRQQQLLGVRCASSSDGGSTEAPVSDTLQAKCPDHNAIDTPARRQRIHACVAALPVSLVLYTTDIFMHVYIHAQQ
jgi:hypothetical protein